MHRNNCLGRRSKEVLSRPLAADAPNEERQSELPSTSRVAARAFRPPALACTAALQR